MALKVRYPIGQQDFKTLRMRDCVYIDKTSFIQKLIEQGSQYYFLARPRRFGKSLFLSTLQYFFEGKKELFKGLFIESADWDWRCYPVLHLDLNLEKYAEPGLLDLVLDNVFKEWETKYGISLKAEDLPSRFRNIIKAAHEKSGQQVVILVDEYDKPLVGNLNKNEDFEHYRTKLSALYSNFKSCAGDIRLVFLTGVSRFSKLSVFSDLNNINDISFDDGFADICGITEKELLENLQTGILELAKHNLISYERACRDLKKNYDGYNFSKNGSDIYNPWSLLNCLDKSVISNYWNQTGLPSLLAESLRRLNVDLRRIFNSYCTEDELRGLDLTNPQPLALLYQTGYLTIKSYNKKIKRYRLGIPNNEVKKGLFDILLPYYVSCKRVSSKQVVDDMVSNFILGNAEEAMREMQAYFAGINYKLRMDNENNFQNAFYLLMDLVGLDTVAEANTSEGSIDILIKTEDFVYVIELKYDHSADAALHQKEEKHYARQFQTDTRQLIKIGVSFSSKTRCIEAWKISG